MARRKSVRLGKGSTETAAQSNSHKLLIPPPRAAVSLAGWASGYTVGEVDISTLFSDLLAQSKRVAEGQVTHVECILLAQATTPVSYTHLDVYKRQAMIVASTMVPDLSNKLRCSKSLRTSAKISSAR